MTVKLAAAKAAIQTALGSGKSVASNAKAAIAAKKGNTSLLALGLGVYSGVEEYQASREEGNGIGYSVARGAFEGILGLHPGLWAAYHGLKDGPELVVQGITAADTWRRNIARSNSNQAFVNAQFEDTQQVHTMRQAGMAIAQRSRYNTQVAMMGNEASYMMK